MIGLVHPGSMGSAVAQCLMSGGHPVAWASDGRSPATRARAQAAGLTDVGSVAHIRAQCDVVLSICPPHGALDIARAFEGYDGLFVDANGISPESTIEVGSIVASGGAHFVDGGIIADDMGLGKTVMLIALHLQRARTTSAPTLVVAPATLITSSVRPRMVK